jgi:isochorismate synthase
VEQNGIKSADVDSGVTFEENMQHSLTHCMPDAQDKEKYGMDAVYPDSRMRALYHTDFDKFHTQLENGSFRKIVLSRCAVESSNAAVDMFRLFVDACSRYPRMFISLVSTSRAGVWLTASPEILLERHCSCDSRAGAPYTFRTIALAGTMPWADDVRWSEKNIREQRYVATYIKKALENASDKIDEEGPYTTRAANLAHLRSDFTFTLQQTGKLGSLLHTLHPTPAVCGLPKDETYKFILNEESSPRHYYSGFQGPLSTDADTHLYVSLRCMNILSGHCLLYAGGGLMKDSDEESEWLETEAKMNTMRDIL